MAFIPVDKIKKLREASKTGDLRAKKILDMQMNGTEDFGPELEDYFANPEPQQAEPAVETNISEAAQATETPYQMYLRENELEDNEDNAREFEQMTGQTVNVPEKKKESPLGVRPLTEDELEAIQGYVDYLEKLSLVSLDPNIKANVVSKLEKIIADERQHIVILDEVEKLLADFTEFHENEVIEDIE